MLGWAAWPLCERCLRNGGNGEEDLRGKSQRDGDVNGLVVFVFDTISRRIGKGGWGFRMAKKRLLGRSRCLGHMGVLRIPWQWHLPSFLLLETAWVREWAAFRICFIPVIVVKGKEGRWDGAGVWGAGVWGSQRRKINLSILRGGPINGCRYM